MIKYLLPWIFLLAGCQTNTEYVTHTEYVVLVPDIVEIPKPPVLQTYDSTIPLDSTKNFKIFQINHLKLIDYIVALHRSLEYYEESIVRLQESKARIQTDHEQIRGRGDQRSTDQ